MHATQQRLAAIAARASTKTKATAASLAVIAHLGADALKDIVDLDTRRWPPTANPTPSHGLVGPCSKAVRDTRPRWIDSWRTRELLPDGSPNRPRQIGQQAQCQALN